VLRARYAQRVAIKGVLPCAAARRTDSCRRASNGYVRVMVTGIESIEAEE
jgi:hypothetical protein